MQLLFGALFDRICPIPWRSKHSIKGKEMNSTRMMFSHKIFNFATLFLLLFIIMACGTENDDGPRFYRFTHQSDDINYTIVAKTSNPQVIAKAEQELQKPFDERRLHINGVIERGRKEYNPDWSWHFIENEWDLVELSTEVCDGRPGFVEDDLDFWVDQVGRFCPWSSRIESEINS